jgi:hypothetical protein
MRNWIAAVLITAGFLILLAVALIIEVFAKKKTDHKNEKGWF